MAARGAVAQAVANDPAGFYNPSEALFMIPSLRTVDPPRPAAFAMTHDRSMSISAIFGDGSQYTAKRLTEGPVVD